MEKFFKDKKGLIYKLRDNNLLFRLSPPIDDNRIVLPGEIEISEVSRKEAHYIVNNQFNQQEYDWTFNGKMYKTLPCTIKESSFEFEPDKVVEINFENQDLIQLTGKQLICLYRGRLYSTELSQYYPRMMLWRFLGIDKESREFCQWTHARNCKRIFVNK